MTLEKQIYDGNRANEILENPIFQSVMEDLKKEITEQWKQSPARDMEGREKLWNLLKLAEKFEAMIKTLVDSGKLAKAELQYMTQRPREAPGYEPIG